MRKFLTVLISILALNSCHDESKYEGYTTTKSGLSYKIRTLGEEYKRLDSSELVRFNYRVFNLNDSSLLSGDTTFYMSNKSFPKWLEFIQLLAVNDSASGYFSNFQETPLSLSLIYNEVVRIELSVKQIKKVRQVEFERKYPNLCKLISVKEQLILVDKLGQYDQDSIQYHQGVFVVHLVKGQGEFPKEGDEVFVNYLIEDFQGRKLDSTFDSEAPFSFLKGTKGQVLDGFSIGIETVKKGGRAIFILPSFSAFGKDGSSTGIVEGNVPLLCEVSLLKIVN